MTHRRRRVSRLLLAVLGLTITVGLFTYVHRLNTSKAAASSAEKAAAVAAGSPTLSPAVTPAEPPTTRAPEVPSADGVAVVQAQPVPTSSKPHVTEAPSPLPPGDTTPAQGGVTIVATAAKPNGFAAGTATGPSRPGDHVAPAPSPSSQNVSIQRYAAPAGGTGTASAPTGTSGRSVPQAKANSESDNLLEARDAANASIASGRLSGGDLAAARQRLAEINQTVVFSSRRFPDDKWGGTYVVQSGDRLDRIGARYGMTPSLLMKLNGIADARKLRSGATIKVLKGPFHAVVNKNAFRLDLYLGAPGGPDSLYVTSFSVGLGKDDSTPEGKWLVEPEKKIKNPVYYSPRGEGIVDADDPKNPLGEYWIGLSGTEGEAVGKQSYGIHGTIEPDSIGKQASMGCVRMRNEDVGVVFDALVEGKSTVVVVD
jgi:lipoprotein-anchoring transpeptidase ErfK/SrfK